MDVLDMGGEGEHGVKDDAKNLGGLIERGWGAGNGDLWVGAVLVGPGGEESDVGLGGGDVEAVSGGPILNGGEVGGQRGLQLLEAGGGTDSRQVVCVGHRERGGGAVGKEKVE